MPKKVHKKLVSAAKKKGLSGERKRAYVYGGLRKVEKARKSRGRR